METDNGEDEGLGIRKVKIDCFYLEKKNPCNCVITTKRTPHGTYGSLLMKCLSSYYRNRLQLDIKVKGLEEYVWVGVRKSNKDRVW